MKRELSLGALLLVATMVAHGQCLTCSAGACVSFVSGGYICVTGGNPPCETRDPCGANGQCWWDGTQWICEASPTAAIKAKTEKLWAAIEAGEYDNRTIHVSAKCGYLPGLLLHQGEGELKVQPDRSFTARDGKVRIVVHDGVERLKKAEPQQ